MFVFSSLVAARDIRKLIKLYLFNTKIQMQIYTNTNTIIYIRRALQKLSARIRYSYFPPYLMLSFILCCSSVFGCQLLPLLRVREKFIFFTFLRRNVELISRQRQLPAIAPTTVGICNFPKVLSIISVWS